MHAAQGGYVDIVKELLSQVGVDPNARTSNGVTALMLAASKNCPGVVELLLRAPGIDVNIEDENGNTALYFAAVKGFTEIVRRLSRVAGIDANLGSVSSSLRSRSAANVNAGRG